MRPNHPIEVSRRQVLGAAGVSLASLVMPSQAFAQQGGRRVLVIAATQDIPNFDPHIATGYSASFLLRNVYDSLVRVEGNPPKPVPSLGSSWTATPDGRSYTFKLNTLAKFQNGKAVTADDVVYSFKRAIRLNNADSLDVMATPIPKS